MIKRCDMIAYETPVYLRPNDVKVNNFSMYVLLFGLPQLAIPLPTRNNRSCA